MRNLKLAACIASTLLGLALVAGCAATGNLQAGEPAVAGTPAAARTVAAP